ncbi:MAG: DUF4334 domain-containing protein [Mycobacteriaceae bacterium]|uniref:DUF4334 domain-containing protein n=1 Tax=Corynebacterium sp. TaxID=1720 RepID=UPI003F9A9DC0
MSIIDSETTTAATLAAMESEGTDLASALEFYDSLPPVDVEQMIGAWHGAGVDTGNPLDGLLEMTGWHGKRYVTADDAHPLVMDGKRGQFPINPALVPMMTAIRLRPLTEKFGLGPVVKTAMPLLKTRKPAARLRMVGYRGVVSGTMVYDRQPINDHFRLVDGDTLLGAMDHRDLDNPFFFSLHREAT